MDLYLRKSLKEVNRRFLFNVDQIEKKCCQNVSSGITFGMDDSINFEEDLCTAENDAELSNAFKREMHHAERDFGSTFLCTPAPDPEETDQKTLNRWKKLNKVFENGPMEKMASVKGGRKLSNRSGEIEGTLMSGEVIDQEFIDVTQQEEEDSPTCSRPEAIETPPAINTRLRSRMSKIDKEYNLNDSIYGEMKEYSFIEKWLEDVQERQESGQFSTNNWDPRLSKRQKYHGVPSPAQPETSL